MSVSRWGVGAACVMSMLSVTPIAQAQITWADVLTFRAPPETSAYTSLLRAKAAADECFDGIGVDYPPINADGSCNVGKPKQNQGYVWGLTQAGVGEPAFAGDEIWFGTVANPLCGGAAGDIIDPVPDETVSWVCEFGESMLARRPRFALPPGAGDWRLPRVYSYSTALQKLTDRTPRDLRFQTIAGLRSAGSLGRAVFLAGPTFGNDVTFAAWDAASGAYHGSCRATALNQIRQWITVNGVLYAGAGRDGGDGVVLRWRGSVENPFNGAGSVSEYCGFEVVGVLPSFPSYLANYDGQRMAASTWNRATPTVAGSRGAPGVAAGIFLGPAYGEDGGYTAADAGTTWATVWTPAQYETDLVVAATTGGGALAFWQGWLWFGSMQNNSGAASAHSKCPFALCYGPPANDEESLDLLFKVSRAASIWRARVAPGGGFEVELLYGQTELPTLVPGTKTFEMKPTGWVPRYGKAGFNNPFVTYTWSMSAGENDLLFGMYDYRYTFDVRLGIVSDRSVPIDPQRGYGADVWRFSDPNAAAQAESVHGFGNFTNYGIRNMLRLDKVPGVFMGTASGLSLEPEAGWELLQLTPTAR